MDKRINYGVLVNKSCGSKIISCRRSHGNIGFSEDCDCTTSYSLRCYDAADICSKPVNPAEYLVDQLIPYGLIDWFSPPECAKTTMVMSLIEALACAKGTWLGRACKSGRVVMIGGEKSSEDVWGRDFQRLGLNFLDQERFMIINPHTYMWEYSKKYELWHYSEEAEKVIIPYNRGKKNILEERTAWLQTKKISSTESPLQNT